jgi:glucarate dehydratase
MKVRDIRGTPVTVPMVAPLLWSMGVEVGTTRTVIELETDEGILGLGETYGGQNTVRAIDFLKPQLIGMDVWGLEKLTRLVKAFCISYETSVPSHVLGGLEMAFLDALGKATGQSVANLLGGTFRTHIPCSSYIFFRREGHRGEPAIESPEAVRDAALDQVQTYGFDTVKLKSGVLPPSEEVRAMQLLRDIDPGIKLRFDPNAAWSVETSLRYLPALRELDMEFVEDPTQGLAEMARVRQSVPIPLATNMCVIDFPQIPLAVHLGSVDVILADVHYWGGPRANVKLAAIAETFGLGLAMHSDRELGISTAAQLHVAAAIPTLRYAIDSHYLHQADDIITEPFRFHDGGLDLPAGPGLGVQLDSDKLAYYHKYYLETGDVVEFGDPTRPAWIPVLPLF